jgi:hypothetical protein
MIGYTLAYAAKSRIAGENARADSVEILMRSVQAHAELGPGEIMRQLREHGLEISRSQVNNLLRGRTR